MEVNDRIELQRLVSRLEEFVALYSDCTVRQVISFLHVALSPGISVTELSRRCSATLTSTSRHYKAFSVEELGEKGLVAAGYRDGRSKSLLVSDNGKRLVSTLVKRTQLSQVTSKELL